MTKKVGLALGGGGARGWAHIGVLRALEEHGIPIDYLAGTSIGALVGSIYAIGALPKLEQFADEIDVDNLVSLLDVSFPGLGLIDGDRIRTFLTDYLSDAQFEETSIPMRCVATNFLLKEEVVFTSGSLVDAVRASISIPGVFVPFQHKEAYFVDGGVVNPVPVNVVKAMGADVAIAVNLNHDTNPAASQPTDESTMNEPANSDVPRSDSSTEDTSHPTPSQSDESGFVEGLVDRYQTLKNVLQDQVDDWIPDPQTGINIFDVLGNSINMMEQQVTQVRLQIDAPHVSITPALMEFGIFDFQQAKPMIQRGYDAATATIPDIKNLIG
jgi:NTE family protein